MTAGFENVPAELRERDQWVCWRYEERGGKPTKVPVSPRTGTPIDHLDPDNRRGFEEAVRFLASPGVDGVGFVFTKDDPYTGVDLDSVFDSETGEAEGWAMEVVAKLGSYTEVSPSGTGLHVFVEGEVPKGGAKTLPDGHAVEVYDRGRFFTVTGRHLKAHRGAWRIARRCWTSFYPPKARTGGRSPSRRS